MNLKLSQDRLVRLKEAICAMSPLFQEDLVSILQEVTHYHTVILQMDSKRQSLDDSLEALAKSWEGAVPHPYDLGQRDTLKNTLNTLVYKK